MLLARVADMKPPTGSLHGPPASMQLVSVTPEPMRPLTPNLTLSIDVLTLLLRQCVCILVVLATKRGDVVRFNHFMSFYR